MSFQFLIGAQSLRVPRGIVRLLSIRIVPSLLMGVFCLSDLNRQMHFGRRHLTSIVCELVDALAVGPTFETRLPCTIDATASGYQHLALMRGAPEEAALVNLMPNIPP